MYVSVCLVHMCVDVDGGQWRAVDALELELQEFVSHPLWVLGTRLRTSGRAVSALNG